MGQVFNTFTSLVILAGVVGGVNYFTPKPTQAKEISKLQQIIATPIPNWNEWLENYCNINPGTDGCPVVEQVIATPISTWNEWLIQYCGLNPGTDGCPVVEQDSPSVQIEIPDISEATADFYEQLLRENVYLKAAIELIGDKEGTRRQFNYIFTHQEFSDYSHHPNKVLCSNDYCSDAAGFGQFKYVTWSEISNRLGLTSFKPKEQLIGMVYLLHRRGVLDDILAGNIGDALPAISCEWAGLPPDNCGYGQLNTKLELRAEEDYRKEIKNKLLEQGVTEDQLSDYINYIETEVYNWSISLTSEQKQEILNREMNEYKNEIIKLYNTDYVPRAKLGQDIVSQTLSP